MLTLFYESMAVAGAELQKLRRDPFEIAMRSVQPILWLLVFGQVFSRTRAIPTGDLSYLDFMTPGILAQSVLFMGIFYGIALIWERDLGVLHKLLVSPAHRSALVLGKALSAGVRGLAQGAVIYLVAFLMGIHLQSSLLAGAGVVAAVLLGAAVFSTFSLSVACIVKTRERFMGIGQVMTMPLFFASNAIYPLDLMPPWLRMISKINPLTYLVDILRTLVVADGASSFGLGFDFAVLSLVLAILVGIAAALYPTVIR